MPITPDSTQNQPTPDAQQQPPVTPSPDQQPTPANPSATTPSPTPSATANNQPTQSQAPQPTPASQPHPVSRIFDGILKTMTGGPVTYIDANGQKQVAPQSRGTMAKSIVAAALAGLLTPTSYREGAFGTKVEDFGGTAANAAQAGKSVMEAARNRPQQMSDEEQARRLQALTNNANLIKTMAASTLQQHEALQKIVDDSAPLMSSIKEYEKTRTSAQPSALIAENLPMEQAKAKLAGNHTTWNAIPTGTETVLNPETGENEQHPVYSIVDTGVKVPLSEEAVKLYSTVNPTYKGAWEATNGKVEVPMTMAVAAQHLVNDSHVLQTFADSSELKTAFPGMKPANIASIIGGPNGRQLVQALDATRDAIAAGSPTYLTLNALRTAPNGGVVLNALGLSSDKVNDYIEKEKNEAIRQQNLAKEGGIGDKAPAPPSMIADLTAAAKKLHPDQAQAIMAGINPNGLTVGEAEKTKNNILAAQNSNTANAQPTAAGPTPTGFVFNPDAPTMDSPGLKADLQKQGVKLPSNFEALYGIAHNANPLTTLPTNPRKGSNQMSAQEGLAFIRQYINPNYQEGDYQAAASLSKELASTRQGTAGGTLYNAGTASQHLELLDEAATALGNHDVQKLNHLANTFGVAVGESPAVTFKAIAEQVNGEVGKVVAGGTPHEAELSELRNNLNSDQSPEQTKKVIKAYVGLMAGRINEINDRSQQYFNRDVKGVSPTTAKVFNKYSVAAPGQVAVTVNGKTGFIPKGQLKTFQQKYPNATVGGQ
jgi:hypothetical protein